MTRRRARVDSTHRAMVDDLRRLGWSVVDLSAAGAVVPGLPDLVIGRGGGIPFAPPPNARGLVTTGDALFVEVKSPGGKLEATQQEWAMQWSGPLAVCETAEDVIAAWAALQQGKRR